MPGRADRDGGLVKSHAKKRELDDTLSLGTGSRDAKRKRTAGEPGHHHDRSTSNSSSFRSRGQDVNGYSASKSSKFQHDTLLFSSRPSDSPVPPTQHSLRPPNSSQSAAKASGAPGSSGASWGAKPSLPGGLFSRRGHHKSHQSSAPNGPPTSSSTSSDASSIPAGLTQTFPAVTPKDISQTTSHSFSFGYMLGNPVAGEGNLQNHNTEDVVLGSRRRQSGPQDRVLPSSRRCKSKNKHLSLYRSLNSSGDEDSYLEGQDEGSNDNGDEHATAFLKSGQGSVRLKARSSGGSILVPEHKTAHFYWDKAPSGRDYHVLFGDARSRATYDSPDESWQTRTAKFALFPDGYKLERVRGLKSFDYVCPVRACPTDKSTFETLDELDKHFEAIPTFLLYIAHRRSEFNDNLDKEGTLDYIGKRRDSDPGEESIVVSRTRRRPPAKNPIPIQSDASKAIPFNENSKSPSLRLDSLSSEDADEDSTSTTPSDLDRAMTMSKVWAYLAPLVPQTWTASITDGLETSAFIQAISLPLRNKMDMEWLSGTRNSHQRTYRALMSVIFQAIGVEALCKPCESKIPERRRNCKVLPPEAEGMRELQEVYGSQCVNCYFFHAAKPCQFPTSSATTKQTPIPVPTPPSTRPMPNVERSLDPPLAAHRPPAPSYSSYKATTAEKPISESPVPIPLFANRGPNHQSRSSQRSDVSAKIRDTGIPRGVRRSGRVAKADAQSGGGSNYQDSDNTDEAESHPAASATSNAGPSEATLTSYGFTSSGPSTKESTAVASASCEISGSQLAGRAFALFGDISRLPAEEQAALWNQMQQMAGMLQTGPATSTYMTKGTPPNLPPGPLAADWEIAPGRLIVDEKHLAFSTSFLSREVVSVKAAQQLSPTQRVLNKSIAALNHLSVGQEDDWDCTLSVVRGVLKVKVGDVEARIGQGGVLVVERECIITNISHKEARIQMWWRKADD